jgi:hypothetical protein
MAAGRFGSDMPKRAPVECLCRCFEHSTEIRVAGRLGSPWSGASPSGPSTTPLNISTTHIHVEPLSPPPVEDGEEHGLGSTKHRASQHGSAGTRRYQRNVDSFDLSASGDGVTFATAHCPNPLDFHPFRADRRSRKGPRQHPSWRVVDHARKRFLRSGLMGCVLATTRSMSALRIR